MPLNAFDIIYATKYVLISYCSKRDIFRLYDKGELSRVFQDIKR